MNTVTDSDLKIKDYLVADINLSVYFREKK